MFDYKNGLSALKRASKSFPNGSGIYKFLEKNHTVLYVGKAKNLKKRISSYIPSVKQSNRIKTLISLTHEISFIKTPNELDSFILENNLIKSLKPRFNIRLMDDKSYPFIMISKSNEWPRIKKKRGKQNRKDIYFGPFANVNMVEEVIQQLERAFLLRSCSDNIFNSRKRPCILYQIKRCSAPCVGKITKTNYLKLVNDAILFLKGKNLIVKENLVSMMKKSSVNQDYEKAAIIRDRIRAISRISFEQYSDLNNNQNFDILFIHKKFNQTFIQIFFFRSGKNLGNKDFFLTDKNIEDDEVLLSQFIIFFYRNNEPPREIFVNINIKDNFLLQKIISPNKKIEIKKPVKGKKYELLKMVQDNILAAESENFQNRNNHFIILNELKEKLQLKNFPNKIEIYDNSHLNGTDAVGAMVVYENFTFSKNSYRKFNIETEKNRICDDYFMMNHIISRRFNFSEKWKEDFPNLIIVDGGKGQLNIVEKLLKEKKINSIDVIGIAKGKKRDVRFDKIYDKNGIVDFEKNDKCFFFLQKLRDEAHRFAVSTHQKRRRRKIRSSSFDNIDGIGKKIKKNLLNHFGTLENIKSASLSDLKKTPGIGPLIANKIYREFNKVV